jgi:hypothetical protein
MHVTPAVSHSSSVLLTCTLSLIPSLTWLSLSGVLGCLGLAGLADCTRQWIGPVLTLGSRIDLSDRIFYVFIPSVSYLLEVVSAGTPAVHWPPALN